MIPSALNHPCTVLGWEPTQTTCATCVLIVFEWAPTPSPRPRVRHALTQSKSPALGLAACVSGDGEAASNQPGPPRPATAPRVRQRVLVGQAEGWVDDQAQPQQELPRGVYGLAHQLEAQVLCAGPRNPQAPALHEVRGGAARVGGGARSYRSRSNAPSYHNIPKLTPIGLDVPQ